MTNLRINGGRELDRLLQTLPLKLEKNVMRAALSDGARLIRAEAKARVPVGAPSASNAKDHGGYAGALRDSIRVTSKFTKTGQATASVKAGGKSKKGADVFYAHMVEYGTRAHSIKAKAGTRMEIAGRFVGGEVAHPGIRPQPFMRPAVDAKLAEAVRAVEAKVRARLQKEGIDVPARVEVDE